MKKAKKAKPDFSKPKPQKIPEEDFVTSGTEAFSAPEIPEKPEAAPETEDSPSGDEFGQTDESATEELKFFPDKSYINLPTVAIAGRPNVGKSTLFNRFMHRRLAIVDPTPGVTRDPVEGTAFIGGKPVYLVDTGGFKLDRDLKSRESEMDELAGENEQ